MFKKAIAFLIAGLLLIAPAAVPVYGQSCEQWASGICGPSCSSHSYNILLDPDFVQTSCPIWEFEWGTERATTGTLCSGWAAPFAWFNGPSPFTATGCAFNRERTPCRIRYGRFSGWHTHTRSTIR